MTNNHLQSIFSLITYYKKRILEFFSAVLWLGFVNFRLIPYP